MHGPGEGCTPCPSVCPSLAMSLSLCLCVYAQPCPSACPHVPSLPLPPRRSPSLQLSVLRGAGAQERGRCHVGGPR